LRHGAPGECAFLAYAQYSYRAIARGSGELGKARAETPDRAFMALAGSIERPANLSQGKGFRCA
jgi:hypothetical protein